MLKPQALQGQQQQWCKGLLQAKVQAAHVCSAHTERHKRHAIAQPLIAASALEDEVLCPSRPETSGLQGPQDTLPGAQDARSGTERLQTWRRRAEGAFAAPDNITYPPHRRTWEQLREDTLNALSNKLSPELLSSISKLTQPQGALLSEDASKDTSNEVVTKLLKQLDADGQVADAWQSGQLSPEQVAELLLRTQAKLLSSRALEAERQIALSDALQHGLGSAKAAQALLRRAPWLRRYKPKRLLMNLRGLRAGLPDYQAHVLRAPVLCTVPAKSAVSCYQLLQAIMGPEAVQASLHKDPGILTLSHQRLTDVYQCLLAWMPEADVVSMLQHKPFSWRLFKRRADFLNAGMASLHSVLPADTLSQTVAQHPMLLYNSNTLELKTQALVSVAALSPSHQDDFAAAMAQLSTACNILGSSVRRLQRCQFVAEHYGPNPRHSVARLITKLSDKEVEKHYPGYQAWARGPVVGANSPIVSYDKPLEDF